MNMIFRVLILRTWWKCNWSQFQWCLETMNISKWMRVTASSSLVKFSALWGYVSQARGVGEEFGSGLDIYIRALVFSCSHLSTLVRLSFSFSFTFFIWTFRRKNCESELKVTLLCWFKNCSPTVFPWRIVLKNFGTMALLSKLVFPSRWNRYI